MAELSRNPVAYRFLNYSYYMVRKPQELWNTVENYRNMGDRFQFLPVNALLEFLIKRLLSPIKISFLVDHVFLLAPKILTT